MHPVLLKIRIILIFRSKSRLPLVFQCITPPPPTAPWMPGQACILQVWRKDLRDLIWDVIWLKLWFRILYLTAVNKQNGAVRGNKGSLSHESTWWYKNAGEEREREDLHMQAKQVLTEYLCHDGGKEKVEGEFMAPWMLI